MCLMFITASLLIRRSILLRRAPSPSAMRPESALRMPIALHGALRFGPRRIRVRSVVMQQDLTRAVVYHNSHFDLLRYNHFKVLST
jgi:hypothetical protein